MNESSIDGDAGSNCLNVESSVVLLMSLSYAREAGRDNQVIYMQYHLNVNVMLMLISHTYFVIDPDTKTPHFFGAVFNIQFSISLNYCHLFLGGKKQNFF